MLRPPRSRAVGRNPRRRLVRESLTELWSGSALGFLGLAAANTLPITVVIERLSSPAGWIAEAARLAGCEARVIEGPASAVLAACEDRHGANGPWVLEVTHRLDGSSFDGERDVAGSVPVVWPRATSVRELMMLDDRAVAIGSAPDLASSFGLHRVLDVELGLASRVGLGRGLAQSGMACVVVEPIPSDGSGVWPAPPKVEVLCEPWVTPATSMVLLFRAAGAEPVRQPQTEFAGVVVVTIGPWRASVPPGVECVVISRLRPCVAFMSNWRWSN